MAATSTASSGAAAATVLVSYGALSATTVYRVYFPSNIRMLSTRDVLRRLGCGFESTRLSVEVDLILDNAAAPVVVGADVTSYGSFSLSNASRASISQRTLTGISPGWVQVSTIACSAFFLVSANSATVVGLYTYAFSNVSVAAAASLTEVNASVPTLVQLSPTLSMVTEGASAALSTFALDDDGQFVDVSLLPGLTVASSSPANMGVSRNSNGNWAATVPVNGATLALGPYLITTLADSCNTTLATGAGYISSTLPSVTSVSFTATILRLAVPGSAAALPPLNLATRTNLALILIFSDGTTRNMTVDNRTVYAVSSSVGLSASVNAGFLYVSNSSTFMVGVVNVSISFPTYPIGAAVYASISVSVVNINGTLALSFVSFPSGQPCSTLFRIQCSSIFQQASVAASAFLTDGTLPLVTGATTFASSSPGLATVVGTLVTGVAPGTVVVTASFSTAYGSMSLVVSSSSVFVTASSFGYASSTLSGPAGATMAPSLNLTFSDGTELPNAQVAYSQRDSISNLVTFSSSNTAHITVNGSGVVALVANSYVFETILANIVCATNASIMLTSSFPLAGNLFPSVYDAKLGALFGLPFPPASFADVISIPVSINVLGLLLSFQFKLLYDTALFGSPVVTEGPNWVSGITSSLGVPGQIQFLGSTALSFVGNSVLTIAYIGLSVISRSSTVVPFALTIQQMAVFSSSVTITVVNSNTPSVSSPGYMVLNQGTTFWGGRRLLQSAHAPVVSAPPRRKLLQSGLLTGDCNGDGILNVGDGLAIQQYVNGMANPVTAANMRQCVPTMSFMRTGDKFRYSPSDMSPQVADAQYLNYVRLQLRQLGAFCSSDSHPAPFPFSCRHRWGATCSCRFLAPWIS